MQTCNFFHMSRKLYFIIHFDHKKLNVHWKYPILLFVKFTLDLELHSFHLALFPLRQTPFPGRATSTIALPPRHISNSLNVYLFLNFEV